MRDAAEGCVWCPWPRLLAVQGSLHSLQAQKRTCCLCGQHARHGVSAEWTVACMIGLLQV